METTGRAVICRSLQILRRSGSAASVEVDYKPYRRWGVGVVMCGFHSSSAGRADVIVCARAGGSMRRQ